MKRRNFGAAFAVFITGIFSNKALAQQEPPIKRIKDTLYDIPDSNTGELFTYSKVTRWDDGSPLTSNKADGIIYRKLGSEVFKRNFSGPVNVRWFGAKGDGVSDDTLSIQKAVDFCFGRHQVLNFPNGDYLITNTITIYNGTQLTGQTGYQYPAGFSRDPKGTRINFRPKSKKSLFTYMYNSGSSNKPNPGFLFHTSVSGFYINGNSTRNNAMNCLYAFDLQNVIYGSFENMGIEGFQTAINCVSTINNRFSNLYLNGTVSSVHYTGVSTTDVWLQCSFWGSPIGIQTSGSPVGIRVTQCLFEAISNYGADLVKETQNMTFENCYCEDVPDNNNAKAAMFRVGYSGGGVSSENIITIIGGKYAGRNSGNAGSFLDTDYISGALLLGVNASRFTTIIKSSPNTPQTSIVIFGMSGVSWNNFTNDVTKIAGSYPNGVLNTGSYHHDARYGKLSVDSNAEVQTLITNYVNPPSKFFTPITDNRVNLGLSNLRWSVVHAGSGTISTSDANEKQQIAKISEAEHKTALLIKASMKKYKFNDAVNLKGDAARIHFGVLAQDVKTAFQLNGLNPHHYGIFCEDSWIEKDGKVIHTPVGEKGEVYRTRLGVRYDELFAFVLSAL